MAVTQVLIARRGGLDVSIFNKILNKRKGPVFKHAAIKQVFKVARVVAALLRLLVSK